MSSPLSQFYISGNLLFISGQVGIDASTDKIPEDFESQLSHVFENLQHVLTSAGASKGQVIKTTVYMTDLAQFDQMNAAYAEYFGQHKPARTTIGVAGLPQFPGDPTVYIEIEAVAEVS